MFYERKVLPPSYGIGGKIARNSDRTGASDRRICGGGEDKQMKQKNGVWLLVTAAVLCSIGGVKHMILFPQDC